MSAQKNTTREVSPKALIIEDEIQMRFYLNTLVKSMGLAPTLAKDGNQGLDILSRLKPAVIILDIMMPNKGGARFYQEFLRKNSWRDIPVVFFSGVDRKAFFHYIKMLNLTDERHIPEPEHFVAKDADPEYLKSVIRECMNKKKRPDPD